MKTCCKCKSLKDFDDFGKNKNNKDGYQYQCKECRNEMHRLGYRKYYTNGGKEVKKKYLLVHKERYDAYFKEYALLNKEKIKAYNIEWNSINKEHNKEISRTYYQSNKEKLHKKRAKQKKDRRQKDPLYKLLTNVRAMIGGSVRNKGYIKKSRTHDILGCSYEEFKIHLELKFESWMTWENHGLCNGELNYGWDIDHVIPISSAKTEEDILRLNHYMNLQPLCSHINRNIKKDKYEKG